MAPALMTTYLILRCLYCRMTSSNISGLISINIFKALYTMPCMVLKGFEGRNDNNKRSLTDSNATWNWHIGQGKREGV